MNAEITFLRSSIVRFSSYRLLGEHALSQLSEEQCFYRPSEETNSIAVIIHHLSGNMRSRWTNFLTEDGEKGWRNRDEEFEDFRCAKAALLKQWEEGWDCLSDALNHLTGEDLMKTVYIRTEPLSVCDAIVRQLMHYSYHIGQIVFFAKMLLGTQWRPLSIPKGESEAFNKKMGMQ